MSTAIAVTRSPAHYHGWTYNLNGSLRGLPVRESFPLLDRDEHGLVPLRVHIMAGFVFVCIEGDAPHARHPVG